MKFYKYLHEGMGIGEDELDKMSSDCWPFIRDLLSIGSVGSLLWSGRMKREQLFVGTVRKNRVPKDTPKEWHEELDRLFYEKFGIRARSNTLFCSPVQSFAESFGISYMIFPMGRYEIIWSPQVTDLYSDVIKPLMSDLNEPAGAEELEDVVDRYTKGNLKSALKSESEIMLSCDEYYGIHYSYKPLIYQWLKDNYDIEIKE